MNNFVTINIFKNPVSTELSISPSYFNYAYSMKDERFRTESCECIMSNAEVTHFAAAVTNPGAKYVNIIEAVFTEHREPEDTDEAISYTYYFRSKDTMNTYIQEYMQRYDVECNKVQLNVTAQFLRSTDIGNTIQFEYELNPDSELTPINAILAGDHSDDSCANTKSLFSGDNKVTEYLIYTNDKDVNTYVTFVDLFEAPDTAMRDVLVVYNTGTEVVYLRLSWFYPNDPIWYYADLFFTKHSLPDTTDELIDAMISIGGERFSNTPVKEDSDDAAVEISDLIETAVIMFKSARKTYKQLKNKFGITKRNTKSVPYKRNMEKQLNSLFIPAGIDIHFDNYTTSIFAELYDKGIILYRDKQGRSFFNVPKKFNFDGVYDYMCYNDSDDDCMYCAQLLYVLHLIIEYNYYVFNSNK